MARTPILTTSLTGETTGAHPAGFTDASAGFGQIQVNAERFHTPYGFSADSIANGTYANDQYGKFRFSAFGAGASGDVLGIDLRFSGSGGTRAGYRVTVTQDNTSAFTVRIMEVTSGGSADGVELVNTTSFTATTSDTFEAEAQGTTIRALKNGVEILAVTDDTYTSGSPGLYAKGGALTAFMGDDIEMGDGFIGTVAGADLAGAATVTATATGNLSTNPTLAGAATTTAAATGDLTALAADRLGALILVDDDINHSFVDGAGAVDGDPYDPIAAGADLEGAATVTGFAAGAIITAIRINGAALIVSSATGALSTGAGLAGSAAAVGLAGGNLTAQIRLGGAAIVQALAAAGLNASSLLAGGAAANALASATLTTQISLNGAALAQALAQGSLGGGAGLAGAAQVSAAASGSLLTFIPVTGAVTAYAQAAGSLSTTPIGLAGAASAMATGSGSLTIAVRFNALALVNALAGGDLVTHIPLSAAALAQAAASGSLATDYTPVLNRRYEMRRPRRQFTFSEAA